MTRNERMQSDHVRVSIRNIDGEHRTVGISIQVIDKDSVSERTGVDAKGVSINKLPEEEQAKFIEGVKDASAEEVINSICITVDAAMARGLANAMKFAADTMEDANKASASLHELIEKIESGEAEVVNAGDIQVGEEHTEEFKKEMSKAEKEFLDKLREIAEE